MLPTTISDQLSGWWFLSAVPNEECLGVRFQPDPERGPGLFAELLYWKPGVLGCVSCSSDVARADLAGDVNANGDIVLTGSIPQTTAPGAAEPGPADHSDGDVDGSVPASVDGTLITSNGSATTILQLGDTLPAWDVLE